MKRTFRRRGAVLAAALVLLCAVSFADRGGPASFAATGWALLPPAVAIVLAFATKEVYSSLLAGCVVGALLTEGFAPWRSFETLFLTLMEGIDLKIFFFDVLLGAIVVLFARSGGSRAFGEWASRRVRSRRGAVTATAGLGCLIFLDDYFNCLTVGAIMQPITDRCRVSREKLSFIIDATAAPVCILAPISSWAAAVSSYIPADYSHVNVFANTDAPMALCFGCSVTLLVMALLYIPRGVMSFSGFVEGFLDGFKLITPALLVLTFAWGLKSFAARLDTAAFVRELFDGRETLTALFPLALFLVGGVLAFATGTSWGTMGILIPVAVPVFAGSPLLPMAVAAVCAGAVMGDHCSPISDTSIMSSTGAGCDHMAHVNTQLWYGLAVAADCTVCYLLAPALGNPWVPLAIGAALVTGQVFLLNRLSRRRAGEAV